MEKAELERIVTTAQDIATMKRDIHHLTQALYEQSQIIQGQNRQLVLFSEKLDSIGKVLSEARGGWKTLVIGGAIGAGILGFCLKLLELWQKLRGVG